MSISNRLLKLVRRHLAGDQAAGDEMLRDGALGDEQRQRRADASEQRAKDGAGTKAKHAPQEDEPPKATTPCAWCNQPADPDKDGFHMALVAFGLRQERHCFCSDDCYDAFRKMYPARVHRDCYERSCAGCDLCEKHFEDESEALRDLLDEMARNHKQQ